MKNAMISTASVALAATFGDWIWATYLSRHLMAAGLVHGALLCLSMGAMVTLPAGRVGRGAAAGLGIGVVAAGLFYALAPLLRTGAMFVAWFALWMMLARLVPGTVPGTNLAPTWHRSVRGLLAGIASGLAFYAVSGMWTRWDPTNVNYFDHFARWVIAFAPGFLALQAGTPARGRVGGPPSDII
jgi:hypothetical protein